MNEHAERLVHVRVDVEEIARLAREWFTRSLAT